MFRRKYGLIVLVFCFITALDSYGQEKRLTADDVSRLETVARPGRNQMLTYRKTTTDLIVRGPASPVQFLEMYESSPPDSSHTFRIKFIKGRMERTELFVIGSKCYKKEANGPWTVSDVEASGSLRPAEPASAKQVLDRMISDKVNIDTALAAALAAAADEDELIARIDPQAKERTAVAPVVTPTAKAETVDVKYEPDKLLNRAPTNFYEVTRCGTSGSGKTLFGYTMIKRVWINKNGTLARTEFESSYTDQPWIQLITDIYEYDPSIKIEVPINK